MSILGAGRDFIGTISTSASVKSLWTTFTLSKESSACTAGREKHFTSSCEPRSIVIGFNFVVQVARDFGDEEITGIFCVFAHVGVEIFPKGATGFSSGNFGDSVCPRVVKGFLGETNFGR